MTGTRSRGPITRTVPEREAISCIAMPLYGSARLAWEIFMIHLEALSLLAQDDGGEVAIWGGGIFMVLMMLGAIIAFGIWLWALINAIQNPALDSTMRLIWVLVIVFTGIVGAIVYLIIGRSHVTQTPV